MVDSAGSSIAKTAAGNIWDSFDTAIGGSVAGASKTYMVDALTNSFFYTSPALLAGLKCVCFILTHMKQLPSGYIGYGANIYWCCMD